MARHVFTAEECRKGDKRACGKKSFQAKAGFHGLSEVEKIRNASLGGRAGGRKTLETRSGIFSISVDEQLKNASLGGQVGGWIGGKKALENKSGIFGLSVDERLKNASLGAHQRWHFSRGVFNLKCEHCLAEMQRKENWGVAVKEPE